MLIGSGQEKLATMKNIRFFQLHCHLLVTTWKISIVRVHNNIDFLHVSLHSAISAQQYSLMLSGIHIMHI